MKAIEQIYIKNLNLELDLTNYQPTTTTLLVGLTILQVLLWSYILIGKETRS